jgi:hypothetical protein
MKQRSSYIRKVFESFVEFWTVRPEDLGSMLGFVTLFMLGVGMIVVGAIASTGGFNA